MNATRLVRWVIIGVFVLVGGTLGFFILRPSNVAISVGSISVVGTDADMKIDRVHIVQNKQGIKSWEMWADTAKVYRKKNYTKMENVHLRFFPKNGKIMDVTADSGLMENGSRNMDLQGNVLIKSQDGFSLKTESLRFRPKEKRIDSDDRVLIEGETFRLSGIGLRGRTDLGEFFLKENIRAVINGTNFSGLNSFSKSADASALSQGSGSFPGGNKP